MTDRPSPEQDVFEAGLTARRALETVIRFAVLIDDKAIYDAAHDLRYIIDDTLDAGAHTRHQDFEPDGD